MLTVNEIIQNYKDIHRQSYNKTMQTKNILTIKNNLQKMKCLISNNLKRRSAFRTGAKIYLSKKKFCGLWAL